MAQQKSTQEYWMDESGNKIPYNRTTKVERLMEKESARLLKQSQQLHDKLKDYKELVAQVCDQVYQNFLEENNVKTDRKGNFTWHNFDRSIKIEVSINERIAFDELQITAAREKLESFLNDNVDGKQEFVKDLVIDAFKTSKGQLDAKKVMGLLKYKSKIKHEMYQQAMEDIEKSIRRPSSKTYYRISIKEDDGSYTPIDLNFSSI